MPNLVWSLWHLTQHMPGAVVVLVTFDNKLLFAPIQHLKQEFHSQNSGIHKCSTVANQDVETDVRA